MPTPAAAAAPAKIAAQVPSVEWKNRLQVPLMSSAWSQKSVNVQSVMPASAASQSVVHRGWVQAESMKLDRFVAVARP